METIVIRRIFLLTAPDKINRKRNNESITKDNKKLESQTGEWKGVVTWCGYRRRFD